MENDTVDFVVFIGGFDFFGNFDRVFGLKIDNFNADVFAVLFFEIDVFGDDGIVAVADDEEGGALFKGADFASLTFFDEAGELFAI